MKNQKVVKQHFVPRFYLANFSDASGKLWAFDKLTSKRFPQSPSNVAYVKQMYDVPELDQECGGVPFLERELGKHEASAAEIIRKWLPQIENYSLHLSDDDKHRFSTYLALQHLRTPEHQKQMHQLSKALSGNMGKSVGITTKELSKITAASLIGGNLVDTFAAAFYSHMWIFNWNPTSTLFYTSDHPLSFKSHVENTQHGGNGVFSKGIEIIYPLSGRAVLHILEREHWARFQCYSGRTCPIPYTVETVKHNNSGQLINSTRWVYCEVDDFDFADSFCAQQPNLRDPDRQRWTTN